MPKLRSLNLNSSFLFFINEKYLSTGSFKGGKHIIPITFKLIFSHSDTNLSKSFKLELNFKLINFSEKDDKFKKFIEENPEVLIISPDLKGNYKNFISYN